VCPFPGTRVWSYTTVNKCAWNPTKLSTSATRTPRGREPTRTRTGCSGSTFNQGIDPSVHSAPGLDLGIRRAQRPVTYRVGFPNRSNKIGLLILALSVWIRRSSLGHGCVAWMSPTSSGQRGSYSRWGVCCWRVRWLGISHGGRRGRLRQSGLQFVPAQFGQSVPGGRGVAGV